MTVASPVSAQTIVKGRIVNERGETVEYVSIGFEEDDGENQSSSIGTISDAKGNFELEIPANCKTQKIAGKAISGPMASFRGKGKADALEWGPVFKNKKDYVLSDILLTIKGTSYQWCVLSLNIYEIQGSKFVNILNKPIYYRLENCNGKQRLDIQPEETIVLKGKKKYYISVAVIDSDRYGILDMQSQFKTSYARNITKGKKRKLPIGPVIQVKGYEIEQ